MQKFICCFLLLIIIAVAFLSIFVQNRDLSDTVSFSIESENGIVQNINIYYDNGKYYAFLPSYTNLEAVKIIHSSASLRLDGVQYTTGSILNKIITDKEYPLQISNGIGISIYESTLTFMKGENIPALSITLIDGTINDINNDQNVSKSGYATIINPDKTTDFKGGFKELHGRGNSTWTQDKKSYTLEFEQETALLGMGSGLGWVLLSNSFDESGLRNKLAYNTAKEIGVDFAVDSKHIDLYVNDVYMGLYLLAERIEVGSERVNINNLSLLTQNANYKALSNYDQYQVTENNKIKRYFNIPNNPSDITGGYLFQIEHHANRIETKESLVQTPGLSFSISSPKYSTQEQTEYLFDYLNEVEAKLKNNDLSLIDVDSFAKYYLIQELFANRDNCSVYFYKDIDSSDNKLHACSIWDFDLSLGNSWVAKDINPEVLYRNDDNWFNYLYKNDLFRDKLAEHYENLIKSNLNEIIFGRLAQYSDEISCSYNMDITRWNYARNTGTDADKSQFRFDNLYEHANYIKSFLEQRLCFLDSAWIDRTEYVSVGFSSDTNINYKNFFSVKKGSSFGEAPKLQTDSQSDEMLYEWLDGSETPFDPNKAITQNEFYTAKWKATNTNSNNAPFKKGIIASLIDKIRARFTAKTLALLGGLGVIGFVIIAVVVTDVRKAIKGRRRQNERRG